MSLANELYIQAEKSWNETAFYKLKSLGNAGNVEAMYLLGVLYQSNSYYQDLSQAAHWYLECAKRRKAFNQHNYNPVTQLLLLSQTSNPNSDVLNNLGMCYEHGYAVSPDIEKAVSYYRQSAAMGNDIAMCNLGLVYKRGRGVELNLIVADYWFTKSANIQTSNATGSLLAKKLLNEIMLSLADDTERCQLLSPYSYALKMIIINIESKIESENWLVKNFLNTWVKGMPSGMKQIQNLIKKTNMDDMHSLFITAEKILTIVNEKMDKSGKRHYLTTQTYADFFAELSNINLDEKQSKMTANHN